MTQAVQKALATFMSELTNHLTQTSSSSTAATTSSTSTPIIENTNDGDGSKTIQPPNTLNVEDKSTWSLQMSFLNDAYREYSNIPKEQQHAMIRLGFKDRFNVDKPTMRKVFNKGKRSTPEPKEVKRGEEEEPKEEGGEKKARTLSTPVHKSDLSLAPDVFKSRLSQFVGEEKERDPIANTSESSVIE